ncbi:MAG: hypothetical protein WCD37_14375 [Chloroflexia bacterium]
MSASNRSSSSGAIWSAISAIASLGATVIALLALFNSYDTSRKLDEASKANVIIVDPLSSLFFIYACKDENVNTFSLYSYLDMTVPFRNEGGSAVSLEAAFFHNGTSPDTAADFEWSFPRIFERKEELFIAIPLNANQTKRWIFRAVGTSRVSFATLEEARVAYADIRSQPPIYIWSFKFGSKYIQAPSTQTVSDLFEITNTNCKDFKASLDAQVP